MIAYIIGYISLVVVPLLCIWYINWKIGGTPKFLSVMKRAAIIMPFTIFLISVPLANLFVTVGFCTAEATDLTAIIAKSLWRAGFPEEVCKILSVILLLLWNRKKGLHINISHIFLCVFVIGCMFAMYENLMVGYPNVGKFFSRHYAAVGHFCYSVMMGYGVCEFLKSKKDYTSVIRLSFWAFVLPVVMHMLYDICPFGIQAYTEFRVRAMFLFGSIACTTANVWIAHRCFKRMILTDRKEGDATSIDVQNHKKLQEL